MQTLALFGAKTLDFLKFMVCPYEEGEEEGWLSVDILRTRGEESKFFCDFVQCSLWTARNIYAKIVHVTFKKTSRTFKVKIYNVQIF